MRFFLLLAAVLIVALHTADWTGKKVTRYTLPGEKLPLKDGSMITFFFPHTGLGMSPAEGKFEEVWISFYDYPEVDVDEAFDVTAHVRIDRKTPNPVSLNTMVNGEWDANATNIETKLAKGQLDLEIDMWRLDLYKHDKYTMTAFFQGFYAGTHKFLYSLDKIKSAYLISDNVNHRELEIPITVTNGNIKALAVEDFEGIVIGSGGESTDKRLLLSNVTFPLDTRIEMIAVIRGWTRTENYYKSLIAFDIVNSSDTAIVIYQEWDEGANKHKLYIDTREWNTAKMCTLAAPVGEIHYLMLERKKEGAEETVTLTMKYNPGKPADPCVVTVSDGMRRMLDQPLNVMSQKRALLFHIDHNIPITKKKREDL